MILWSNGLFPGWTQDHTEMGCVGILSSSLCLAYRHLDPSELGERGLAVCSLTYFLRYKIDVDKKSSNKGPAAIQKYNSDPAIQSQTIPEKGMMTFSQQVAFPFLSQNTYKVKKTFNLPHSKHFFSADSSSKICLNH